MPNPLRRLVDLFSSVRFGIVLLAVLFVYMSVGSAGILYPVHPNVFHPDAWVHAQFRQWRPFEMTEFEWFHWWPFNLLMGLLAANIVITTLRRIPLRTVNLGVWMIHAGVITLVVGSVIYFGTKVEGEVAVVRRAVVVELWDAAGSAPAARAELIASPGNRATVGEGDRKYELEVQSTDPEWELKSGADQGKRTYSVNVLVTHGTKRFIRQVLAGYPQYTEDVLFTGDSKQPMKRAVKETGKPIVDEGIRIALDYRPADSFYLKNDLNKSWALYVRRPGEQRWHQRPVHGLPLYNDYVSDLGEVYLSAGETLAADPIRVAIPPDGADDPAPGVTLEATGYVRYAQMRARWVEGGAGADPNPVLFAQVADKDGRSSDYRLVARDPQKRSADGGVIALRELRDEEDLPRYLEPPTLAFRVKAKGIDIALPVKEAAIANAQAEFRPIGPADSGYAYRVVGVQDDLPIGGRELSVAILELRTPAGTFRRWTFSDATMSRDLREGEDPMAAMKRGGESWVDPTIEVEYRPGNGLALVLFLAGPEPGRLRMVDALQEGKARVMDVKPRVPVELAAGLRLAVAEWFPNAVQEAKPMVVPQAQRQRDARELFSMMRLTVPAGGAAGAKESSAWLTYHPWAFDSERDVLRRYWLTPTTVRLPDGSELEVLFSRQRLPLPAPVALESFVLATNIGGFSGDTSSIRNYTSVVRFGGAPGADGRPTWSAPEPLSVNEPVERDGYWFFQSQWDPPDEARQGGMASAGLNYTVLGVGNRNGVWIQLAGCVIACAGMAWAFYVKPVIKRRNRRLVLEEIARAKAEGRAPHFPKGLQEDVHA